jgi:hypothetical protein
VARPRRSPAPAPRANDLPRTTSALGADDLKRAGISSRRMAAESIDDATPEMLAALDTDLASLAPRGTYRQTVASSSHERRLIRPRKPTRLSVAYGSAPSSTKRQFTEGWDPETSDGRVHAAHAYQFLRLQDTSSFASGPPTSASALAVRDHTG